MLFKFDSRVIVFSIILTSILVLLGSYFFAFRPTLAKIEQLRGDLEGKQLQLEEVNKSALEFQELEKELLILREELEELDMTMPEDIKLSAFLSDIEELARRSDVKLEIFSPREVTKKENYNKQAIDLLLSGSYQSMVVFLEKIESMKRLINIESLGIVDRGNGDVELEAYLYIYSLDGE
ncbi:type 4a pilus biogenesis protein PilO [Halonatronum saccharophilum]|uniref:type 4a pilus biogenesis protein PilO n=1 Tax=Halonatronum saccharophilum TaxID=150060 RepID=UPI0004825F2A|nr:type 4a pilus biogenesis protein PilO [Halonatronum saccharophilum]